MHERNPHTVRMGAPLYGGQVRAGAKIFMAAAVLGSVHCIVSAAETTRLLGCRKRGEEAGIGLVEVDSAERVGTPCVAGALVAGGGCCGALTGRHDRCCCSC